MRECGVGVSCCADRVSLAGAAAAAAPPSAHLAPTAAKASPSGDAHAAVDVSSSVDAPPVTPSKAPVTECEGLGDSTATPAAAADAAPTEAAEPAAHATEAAAASGEAAAASPAEAAPSGDAAAAAATEPAAVETEGASASGVAAAAAPAAAAAAAADGCPPAAAHVTEADVTVTVVDVSAAGDAHHVPDLVNFGEEERGFVYESVRGEVSDWRARAVGFRL